MSVTDIAQQLHETNENILLVYAFNATGKTRLSVAYKDYTKSINEGNHSGVYYNAFSEDLFIWENDEENDNANIRLKILQSSLNQFHSLLTEEALKEKLRLYRPQYQFTFNLHDDLENGIESVSFFSDEGEIPIKISRGEERIFVWCFFLALFEVEGWATEQNAHFFIDDPVSSLDEHNIFITVGSIFDLIEEHYLEKRIIITTHHIGLFSILSDRLKRGEKRGRYDKLTKLFILSNQEKKLVLGSPKNDVLLFHLHLLQTLDIAIKTDLFAYHFVLLRQLLENISSYLGAGGFGYCLAQIGIEDIEEAGNTINSLSHKTPYQLLSHKMSPTEENIFRDIFQKLQAKYNFRF